MREKGGRKKVRCYVGTYSIKSNYMSNTHPIASPRQCPRHAPPANLPPRENLLPDHHARIPTPEARSRGDIEHRSSVGIRGWGGEFDHGRGFDG